MIIASMLVKLTLTQDPQTTITTSPAEAAAATIIVDDDQQSNRSAQLSSQHVVSSSAQFDKSSSFTNKSSLKCNVNSIKADTTPSSVIATSDISATNYDNDCQLVFMQSQRKISLSTPLDICSDHLAHKTTAKDSGTFLSNLSNSNLPETMIMSECSPSLSFFDGKYVLKGGTTNDGCCSISNDVSGNNMNIWKDEQAKRDNHVPQPFPPSPCNVHDQSVPSCSFKMGSTSLASKVDNVSPLQKTGKSLSPKHHQISLGGASSGSCQPPSEQDFPLEDNHNDNEAKESKLMIRLWRRVSRPMGIFSRLHHAVLPATYSRKRKYECDNMNSDNNYNNIKDNGDSSSGLKIFSLSGSWLNKSCKKHKVQQEKQGQQQQQKLNFGKAERTAVATNRQQSQVLLSNASSLSSTSDTFQSISPTKKDSFGHHHTSAPIDGCALTSSLSPSSSSPSYRTNNTYGASGRYSLRFSGIIDTILEQQRQQHDKDINHLLQQTVERRNETCNTICSTSNTRSSSRDDIRSPERQIIWPIVNDGIVDLQASLRSQSPSLFFLDHSDHDYIPAAGENNEDFDDYSSSGCSAILFDSWNYFQMQHDCEGIYEGSTRIVI